MPPSGAGIDLDYRFHFESFDENGICELWIPVKDCETNPQGD